MIENVLVRHLSVASEAEKICAVECCEVEEEGGSEGDDEEGGCVGALENCTGNPW